MRADYSVACLVRLELHPFPLSTSCWAVLCCVVLCVILTTVPLVSGVHKYFRGQRWSCVRVLLGATNFFFSDPKERWSLAQDARAEYFALCCCLDFCLDGGRG